MTHSPFAKKVIQIVAKIKKGTTLTYKDVATLAGNPRASRAVGSIIGTNYDLNIPCHRVIRTDGKMGGYNRGVDKKIALLKSEGVLLDQLS